MSDTSYTITCDGQCCADRPEDLDVCCEGGEGGTGETRLTVADATPEERVELTAAGERIVVRPRLPLALDAVECADPEVASRVTGLLERVQRASLPLS